ncbi:Transcriptional regulator, TetR family [Bacillus cereus]|nr:Transcriptional regulator, TetR family [Bacillus cereus]
MSPRIGLTLPKIVETAAEIADANGIQEVTNRSNRVSNPYARGSDILVHFPNVLHAFVEP